MIKDDSEAGRRRRRRGPQAAGQAVGGRGRAGRRGARRGRGPGRRHKEGRRAPPRRRRRPPGPRGRPPGPVAAARLPAGPAPLPQVQRAAAEQEAPEGRVLRRRRRPGAPRKRYGDPSPSRARALRSLPPCAGAGFPKVGVPGRSPGSRWRAVVRAQGTRLLCLRPDPGWVAVTRRVTSGASPSASSLLDSEVWRASGCGPLSAQKRLQSARGRMSPPRGVKRPGACARSSVCGHGLLFRGARTIAASLGSPQSNETAGELCPDGHSLLFPACICL